MGGDITVKSEIGQGSTFYIELPITQNAVLESEMGFVVPTLQASGPLDQLSVPTSTGGSEEEQPTLLIIEDNVDLVQYLESFLESHYQLLIANDGEKGIEQALENIPDLVVSDIMMPKKDGLEVCTTLKNHELTSHIPVVLLTAKADIESRIAGLKRGADAYMPKPFNQNELIIRLEKLYELRQHLQRRYQSTEPLLPSTDIHIQQEDSFVLKLKEAVEEKVR